MKKFIVILCFMLTVNCSPAADSNSKLLDNIENSLYGFTYTTQDDATRLNRIEESVYGQTSNKSTQQRIAKLKTDMAADLIGQEIAPKEDTFAEDQDSYKDRIAEEKLPPAGANVDYPSINELEKQVFKQEFKNKDLNSRLASLEEKSLGKTYADDDFSSRVERLQAKIKPKSFMDNSIAQSSNDYFDGDAIPLDKNYRLDRYEAPDFDYDAYNARNSRQPQRVNLASVEKSIFKRSFAQESMDNRLSRLESTMFGTTFNSNSEQERIDRSSSAYKAQKTASKYDSNKFSQNMATAVQIGTLILMVLACIL